jgi:hypothetical protein
MRDRCIGSEEAAAAAKATVSELEQTNRALSEDFEQMATVHATCDKQIATMGVRNRALIELSERAQDHTVCNKHMAELKRQYAQLQNDGVLKEKQVSCARPFCTRSLLAPHANTLSPSLLFSALTFSALLCSHLLCSSLLSPSLLFSALTFSALLCTTGSWSQRPLRGGSA